MKVNFRKWVIIIKFYTYSYNTEAFYKLDVLQTICDIYLLLNLKLEITFLNVIVWWLHYFLFPVMWLVPMNCDGLFLLFLFTSWVSYLRCNCSLAVTYVSILLGFFLLLIPFPPPSLQRQNQLNSKWASFFTGLAFCGDEL